MCRSIHCTCCMALVGSQSHVTLKQMFWKVLQGANKEGKRNAEIEIFFYESEMLVDTEKINI